MLDTIVLNDRLPVYTFIFSSVIVHNRIFLFNVRYYKLFSAKDGNQLGKLHLIDFVFLEYLANQTFIYCVHFTWGERMKERKKKGNI